MRTHTLIIIFSLLASSVFAQNPRLLDAVVIPGRPSLDSNATIIQLSFDNYHSKPVTMSNNGYMFQTAMQYHVTRFIPTIVGHHPNWPEDPVYVPHITGDGAQYFDWRTYCMRDCHDRRRAIWAVDGFQKIVIPGYTLDPNNPLPIPTFVAGGDILVHGTAVQTFAFEAGPTFGVGVNARIIPGDGGDVFVHDNDKTAYTFTSAVILPVTLVSFTAESSECDIKLNWSVAVEEAFDYYEVQKSEDGKNFTTIGTLEGVGNNSSYEFIDEDVSSKEAYYRLKMVDLDNTFEYSKTVVEKANCPSNSEILLFPNPTADYVTVSGIQVGDSISLVNENGQLVYAIISDQEQTTINLSKFSSGLYTVVVENKLGKFENLKLVKN